MKLDNVFSNGNTVIRDNDNNFVVLLVQTSTTGNVNYYVKDIFDVRTITSITVSRWDIFYTLSVRAPHSVYQVSTGTMVNGCTASQLSVRRKRDLAINPVCVTPCKAMSESQFSIPEMSTSTL